MLKDLHLNLAPNWCVPLTCGFLLLLNFVVSICTGRKKKHERGDECGVALVC